MNSLIRTYRPVLDNHNYPLLFRNCALSLSKAPQLPAVDIISQNYCSSYCWNNTISSFRNFSSQHQHPKTKNLTLKRSASDKVEDIEVAAEGGIKLDMDLVQHLERISLVDFDNEEALERLEEAVQFANTLFEVDTTHVEPLTSVLEDVELFLREDKVGATCREDILANASVTEEDYFVAPPGNIPLESTGSLIKKNR